MVQLVEPWDVFDLDDGELAAQLAAAEGSAAAGADVGDLLDVLRQEVAERKISTDIIQRLTGGTPQAPPQAATSSSPVETSAAPSGAPVAPVAVNQPPKAETSPQVQSQEIPELEPETSSQSSSSSEFDVIEPAGRKEIGSKQPKRRSFWDTLPPTSKWSSNDPYVVVVSTVPRRQRRKRKPKPTPPPKVGSAEADTALKRKPPVPRPNSAGSRVPRQQEQRPRAASTTAAGPTRTPMPGRLRNSITAQRQCTPPAVAAIHGGSELQPIVLNDNYVAELDLKTDQPTDAAGVSSPAERSGDNAPTVEAEKKEAAVEGGHEDQEPAAEGAGTDSSGDHEAKPTNAPSICYWDECNYSEDHNLVATDHFIAVYELLRTSMEQVYQLALDGIMSAAVGEAEGRERGCIARSALNQWNMLLGEHTADIQAMTTAVDRDLPTADKAVDQQEHRAPTPPQTIIAEESRRDREETSEDQVSAAKQLSAQSIFCGVGANYRDNFTSFYDLFVRSADLSTCRDLSQEDKQQLLQALLMQLQTWLREVAQYVAEEDGSQPPDGEDPPALVEYTQGFKGRCFKVQRSRREVYDLLSSVADTRVDRWEEIRGPLWELWWSWRRPRPKETYWLATQMVNHIPGSQRLTRKSELKKALQRYCRDPALDEKDHPFNITPQSFILPGEYVGFTQRFSQVGGVWIMKPVGLSRGKGITLVRSIEDVRYSGQVVLQQYVMRPLLIDGYKFDLRLYVVVTQFNPLEAFLSATNGFARFACFKYTDALTQTHNRYVHLTNTAVSNEAKDSSTEGTQPPLGECKWSLERLARFIDTHNFPESWESIWRRISDTVLKTLACVEGGVPPSKCSFELFGFDVLLDSALKPWVLEVNASPSMEVETALDEEVKPRLIDETIDLVDPVAVDRWALHDIVVRRLGELRAAKIRRRPIMGSTSTRQGQVALSDADNADIGRILQFSKPRKYGERPTQMGGFQMVAPSAAYDHVCRLKRGV